MIYYLVLNNYVVRIAVQPLRFPPICRQAMRATLDMTMGHISEIIVIDPQMKG